MTADRVGESVESEEDRRPAGGAGTGTGVAIALLVWFLAVTGVARGGLLVGLTPAVVGAYVTAAVSLLGLLGFGVPGVRAWLRGVPVRGLVLVHVVRFIGVAFVVSADAPGGLPAEFADRAGYGDIFAAITAFILAVGFLPADTRFRRGLLLAWNVVGTLDLLAAVGTAVAINLSGSPAMAPLVAGPLMMYYAPLYFVPLLLFTHLVIFVRAAGGTLGELGTRR